MREMIDAAEDGVMVVVVEGALLLLIILDVADFEVDDEDGNVGFEVDAVVDDGLIEGEGVVVEEEEEEEEDDDDDDEVA